MTSKEYIMNSTSPSEEIHSRIFDKFVSNAIIKTGYGLGLGVLFSLTIFRPRTFPIFIGSGIGFGYALSDLNKHLSSVK